MEQISLFDLLEEPEEAKQEPEADFMPRPVLPAPKCFQDYVGRCEFCYWFGYGMRKNGRYGERTAEVPCQWAVKSMQIHRCRNRDKWMPDEYRVMGLCANCEHGNMFHEVDENGKLTDKEIYCTHPDGPLNRIELYPESREPWDGWHRNHEFDHCDRWQKDSCHNAEVKDDG